jgi:hypothetical protein
MPSEKYRITESDLDRAVSMLSDLSGYEYGIDKAYGGYKLVSKDGSVEFSLRGTKREIHDHIRVAIAVLVRNKQVAKR